MKVQKIIRKPFKWVKRNPELTGVIVISIVLLALAIYYYLKRNPTPTPINTRTSPKYRIPTTKRTFDVTKVYKMIMLTDVESWKVRMSVISAAGFDTIQIVVPIGETYSNFDKHIECANVAVSLGLNIVLKPWIIFNGGELATIKDFIETDMQTSANGNRIFGSRYHLSLSSPKWSKVYEWVRRFKNAFQPFYDAGYVIACFPANHTTQEWGYQYNFAGDFSDPETAASGGLNKTGTNTLAYHRFMANNLKTRLSGIASILNDWRVGFDAGSFYYGFHKFTGTFNYDVISDIPNVKWLKNNPIINTSKDFDAGLQYDWKQRRGGFYCVEWTNADGATADTLAIHHRNTIYNGGNLCSFAFGVPDSKGGGTGWEMAKQIRQILIDSSDWNKPVQTPQRNGLLAYSLERIFNENGYEQSIRGEFQNIVDANGGVLPNVRCTG